MPYCGVVDLLIGDIATGGALDPTKYVSDAADEIDSKIGFRYVTPVVTNNVPRPVALLLKRLNAHLASGRLILAATISAEDERLNAYGENLVASVELSLLAIAEGEQVLPLTPINTDTVDPTIGTARPFALIKNEDPESNVSAFYNRIAMPGGFTL